MNWLTRQKVFAYGGSGPIKFYIYTGIQNLKASWIPFTSQSPKQHYLLCSQGCSGMLRVGWRYIRANFSWRDYWGLVLRQGSQDQVELESCFQRGWHCSRLREKSLWRWGKHRWAGTRSLEPLCDTLCWGTHFITLSAMGKKEVCVCEHTRVYSPTHAYMEVRSRHQVSVSLSILIFETGSLSEKL